MWLVLAVFGITWLIGARRVKGFAWPEALVTLGVMLGVLLVLAWLLPGWVWKAALLGYVLFPWAGGVFLVWRRQRIPAEPGAEPYDPERHAVPPALRDQVERKAAALEAEALVRAAAFWSHDSQATVLMVLMESADGHEGAMVAGYEWVIGAGTEMEVRTIEVTCHYAAYFVGGRRLVVTNADRDFSGLVPGTRVELLPNETDPVRLLAFARAYRAGCMADARTLPLRGRMAPLDWLSSHARSKARAFMRTGQWRPLPEGGYGYTLRGALLGALRATPPFRQMDGLRLRLREARLMRRLGMAPPGARATAGGWWLRDSDLPVASAIAIVLAMLVPAPPIPLPLAADFDPSASFREARPYELPQGFTVPADFPGAVRALEVLAGMPSAPLEVEDASSGDLKRSGGVEVRFAADRTDSMLVRAAPLFRGRGFLLFRHENTSGIDGAPEFVALYPRADEAEVMRLVGTNGGNFGIGTDSVVAWMERLRTRHPFVLIGIAHDAVEGRFTPAPDARQAAALAEEFYAFCPDVVTQGVRTVPMLAQQIQRGILYCWWD